MALADYPLGVGPLGHAPVAAPSTPGKRQELAVLIHPGTHDAIVLEDGSLLGVHPVDQAVSLALGIEASTVNSVPTQGHKLRQIVYAGRDLKARVQQAVEAALRLLINRGDIALDSVTTTRTEGGFFTDIEYRNLRLTPGAQKRSVRVTSTG